MNCRPRPTSSSGAEKVEKPKTTGQPKQGGDKKSTDDSNHSSEKRRKRVKKNRPSQDRRTFKDLTIHDTIECPVDPRDLPPDAVRMPDEKKVVQDVVVKPNNILFQRHVYYAAYFTRPQKDRLTVLEILQNASKLRFRFGKETLRLLQAEFDIPKKWR